MSGILLPGQDRPTPPKEENQGSGIVLPKGYEHRRKETRKDSTPPPEPAAQEVAPPPSATPASPPPGAQPRQGAAARREQPEFLFPPRGVQIQCPNCRTPFVVPVFTIMDLGVNPELKGALLSGQVNVAACPRCGAGGPLNVPLLIHEPEHQFLAVYAPTAERGKELQQQKTIGDLQQSLLRKLPKDARKGYMLQPQQFFDWQRLIEKLWEFEGVAPEVLRRQNSQSELLQRLITLTNDDSALKIAIDRSKDLIDQQFFAILEQLAAASSSQGQADAAQRLIQLRNKLLDMTEAGQEVKKRQEHVRGVLNKLGQRPSRQQLVATFVEEWLGDYGQDVVATLAMAAGPLLDYEFLMLLAQQIEQTEDPDTVAQLNELREFVLEIQQQQRENAQAMVQGIQQLVSEILQANDTMAALREHIDYIDENFLGVLAAQAQNAQRQGAIAAARRLQQVYEQAVAVLQEQMPEDIRLLQQMVAAPDEAAARQLLRDNRNKLTKDFVETMKRVESQMRESSRTDIADRLKSLRGQIALMV